MTKGQFQSFRPHFLFLYIFLLYFSALFSFIFIPLVVATILKIIGCLNSLNSCISMSFVSYAFLCLLISFTSVSGQTRNFPSFTNMDPFSQQFEGFNKSYISSTKKQSMKN